MKFEGKMADEKMSMEVNYELTNQTLAGTWMLQKPNLELPSPSMTPLWFDWDTDIQIRFGEINMPGLGNMSIDTYTPNELQGLLYLAKMIGVFDAQQMIADLLQSITAMPNGSL